ncbi:hypothetical protein [Nostocoides japonicum]|nr:hypothetical protein [Tetrasphaera japonica]
MGSPYRRPLPARAELMSASGEYDDNNSARAEVRPARAEKMSPPDERDDNNSARAEVGRGGPAP